MAMDKTIKLTPELLKTQGEKLGEISDSYRTTLKQVDRVLKQVNNNWSYRLANNFGTKIHSVAKSSEKLVTLLEQSSAAAINAGESFTSIDSQLAKFIGGNGKSSNESSIKTVSIHKNPSAPKINSIKDLLNYLDNVYDKNLTEEQQKLLEEALKEVFGKDFVKIIKILKKIVQGKFDWKTGVDTLSLVFGLFAEKFVENDTFFKTLWTTLKTVPKYMALGEKYEREIMENLEKGNVVGAIAALGKDFFTLGKAVVDVACQMVDSFFNISLITSALEVIYGWDINGAFSDASSAINGYFDSAFDL
ncbi:MAG: WXG100 family type VII secretion target [Candidatus Fimenecus sp.]